MRNHTFFSCHDSQWGLLCLSLYFCKCLHVHFHIQEKKYMVFAIFRTKLVAFSPVLSSIHRLLNPEHQNVLWHHLLLWRTTMPTQVHSPLAQHLVRGPVLLFMKSLYIYIIIDALNCIEFMRQKACYIQVKIFSCST